MKTLDRIRALLDSGISVIPVNENKTPAIKSWKGYTKEIPDFNNLKHKYMDGKIAMICGKVSGGLEAIDIDSKYDLAAKLAEQYFQRIKEQDQFLMKKLVIQQTPSGGYHLIFKSLECEGNLKLAQRETTEQEKEKNPGERRKVLIETRGEGGYLVCSPTPKYKIIQGDLCQVTEISLEEREILLASARSFNQVFKTKTHRHILSH